MNEALQQLVNGLRLEKLEENLFRGAIGDTHVKRVYGGKVLGEALEAAQLTVEDRPAHSLHAYFLREADSFHPVVYDVERSRDGKSFSTLFAVLYHLTGEEQYRETVLGGGQGEGLLSVGGYYPACDHWLLHQPPKGKK